MTCTAGYKEGMAVSSSRTGEQVDIALSFKSVKQCDCFT